MGPLYLWVLLLKLGVNFLFSFSELLRMELRASDMLSKDSATELYLPLPHNLLLNGLTAMI